MSIHYVFRSFHAEKVSFGKEYDIIANGIDCLFGNFCRPVIDNLKMGRVAKKEKAVYTERDIEWL